MMGVTQMFSAIFGGNQQDGAAGPAQIQVHPDTADPTLAWEKLMVKQTVNPVQPLSRKTLVHPNKVRFVCVSDTHNRTIKAEIPDGDVLLHAGDFTMVGKPEEVVSFNKWLGSLPHKHKVVIAGNHDMSFDEDMMEKNPKQLHQFGLEVERVREFMKEHNVTSMKEVLTNCTYLEDEEISLYGLRIYGSPWQPWFYDWGFNLERGQPCLDKWNKIPDNIDVLMTHGPPIGHGDLCTSKQRAGCVELLSTIQQRVKCKYHVFGHIHEGYGVTTDGQTTYINACTCTYNYRGSNPAIIFDIPLPPGVTKDTVTSDTASVGGEDDMEVESSSGSHDDSPATSQDTPKAKGPLVLSATYQLDPTPAPHSSTSVIHHDMDAH